MTHFHFLVLFTVIFDISVLYSALSLPESIMETCSVVLTFESVDGVAIQMKPVWYYFCMIVFVFGCFTK